MLKYTASNCWKAKLKKYRSSIFCKFAGFQNSIALQNPFHPGDTKVFVTVVSNDKLARFAEGGLVHPVYSTFALGNDAEWASRLFVLEMKETGEEGIGSYLTVDHLYPAPLGSEVSITATLVSVNGNEVNCEFVAVANSKTIAKGTTGQKIINKAKFDALLKEIADQIK